MAKAYTQEQIAKIISDYVDTGSLREVRKRNKCSVNTITKYLNSEYGKQMRDEMESTKKKVISQTWKEYFEEHRQDWIRAVDTYMEHLLDPAVIATANARDTMTILGILNDKLTRETANVAEKESDGSGVAILPAVLPDDPDTKGGE